MELTAEEFAKKQPANKDDFQALVKRLWAEAKDWHYEVVYNDNINNTQYKVWLVSKSLNRYELVKSGFFRGQYSEQYKHTSQLISKYGGWARQAIPGPATEVAQ